MQLLDKFNILKVLYLYNHMERWQSWSIASDLKSDEVQASVGSNPTFSVFNEIIMKIEKY